MTESAKNEFTLAKKVGVGKKMTVLSLLLWKLDKFTHFTPFGPILATPGAKFGGNGFSEGTESDKYFFR